MLEVIIISFLMILPHLFFFFFEIVKKILNKISMQISWLGYFLSLDRLNYYNKLIMPNFAYEKRLQKILKNNKI